MSKEIEMKMDLLEQLKSLMMGNSGSKFKPKEVTIEVLAGKPEEEEEDPMDGNEDCEDMDDEKNPKKRKTLKEFLSSLEG